MNDIINIKSGENFGSWEYLGTMEIRKSRPFLLCMCKCGSKQFILWPNLKRGSSTKCRSCSLKKDITDLKFGKLTPKLEVGKNKHGRVMWYCVCDCGGNITTTQNRLSSGRVKSCGCLLKEMHITGLINRYSTHGMTNTPIYVVWSKMKGRCNNIKNVAYHNYGGRGIKVCERWNDKENGFANFYADMGERPEGFTLERIDNNKGYEPDNCKWIPKNEQQKNTRNTYKINIEGDVLCLADACRRLDLKYETVQNRIRRGWAFEKALELI